FAVVGGGSTGPGARPPEALAGRPAEDYVTRQLETLEAVARTLEVPPAGAQVRAERLLTELAEVRRRVEGAERRAAQQGLDGLLREAEEVATPDGAFRLLAVQVDPASAP